MFPDSSLTTSFSSPLCFFIRADVLWKLPRLTALWKTWGNFRASSPSVPQVFHRAFEIASRFQRAAWKTLRVSHSSHRTLLLDIYRPQDARNHNLPRRVGTCDNYPDTGGSLPRFTTRLPWKNRRPGARHLATLYTSLSPHPSRCPSSPRSNPVPKGADPRTPCGSYESLSSDDSTSSP